LPPPLPRTDARIVICGVPPAGAACRKQRR
jgi:hypothetical protein